MSYTDLFSLTALLLVLKRTQNLLHGLLNAWTFSVPRTDDYIKIRPGMNSPGHRSADLLYNLVLKLLRRQNHLLDMRTQIRYYSSTAQEIEVVANPDPDALYPNSLIPVVGPPGATVLGASLVWEGTVRNQSAGSNELLVGEFGLSPDGTTYAITLDMSSRIKLGNHQISWFRLAARNVLSIWQGDQLYRARFYDLQSLRSSLFLIGHWILIVDYELL